MASRYHFLQPKPGIGENLGQALGSGLGSVLTSFAEGKLNSLVSNQRKEENKRMLREIGIPESKLDIIASRSPEEQWDIIRNLWVAGGNDPQQLPQQLGQQLPQQIQQQPGAAMQALGAQAQPQQVQAAPPRLTPEAEKEERFREALQKPKTGDKFQEKVALEEEKARIKERQQANKETLPVYHEVNKAAKAADDSDKRLNRMEKLVNEGNLGIPAINSLLRTISHGIMGHGIDLSSWMTADAQEFEKLSNDFIRGAKDVFGARITDADLSAFMKTVPNLSQSGAGIKRLIRSMKSFNEAARVRKKAMNEIIKENNGNRPWDLETQIDQRAGSLLDALSKDFAEGERIPERLGGGIIRY